MLDSLKRTLLAVTVLATPALAAAQEAEAAPRDEAVVDYLDDGDRQMRAQSWSTAVAAYERAATLAPDRSEVWYRLAVALTLTGQLRRAEDALSRAGELDPALPGLDNFQTRLRERIAAEAEQALDRPGFFEDAAVREESRLEAASAGDWVLAARASLTLDPMVPAEAEAYLARHAGDLETATMWAEQALGDRPQALDLYLLNADLQRMRGARDAATHYLDLYTAFGGDLEVAAALVEALNYAPSAR